MLWLYKRIIFGETNSKELASSQDLKSFEMIVLVPLAITIIFFGFFPELLMNSIHASVENTLNIFNSKLIDNLALSN